MFRILCDIFYMRLEYTSNLIFNYITAILFPNSCLGTAIKNNIVFSFIEYITFIERKQTMLCQYLLCINNCMG